jgi:DNA-directed RNA polymerase sigma subunit (sigma70/sigma32)
VTSVTQPDDRHEGLFVADFYPELGAWLARQHEGGYDAAAERARFLIWLGTHAVTDAPTPRLSAEEEAGLARRIQAGRQARKQLTEEGQGLDDQLRGELERVATDGVLAGTRLQEANFWLVMSLAERFADRGVPLQDLAAEGTIGLIRAMEKYDPAKGYRFATYATWWVRQAITRATKELRRVRSCHGEGSIL